MNWIRIAIKMRTSVSVRALSKEIGKDMASAIGHVCCVLLMLPDHARDGDLRHISNDDIEEWALWRGKAGKFAPAFITHLCTGERIVRVWEQLNGSAIRSADTAKDRVKKWRDEKKANVSVTRNVRRTESVAYANRTLLRDGTLRDDTTTTASAAAAAVVGTTEPATTATTEQDALLAQFADPKHRDAVGGYLRAAQYPTTLAAELQAQIDGMHGPGGQPVGAAIVGQALHEMRVAGIVRPTSRATAKFIAELVRPSEPAPSFSGTEPDETAAMLARIAAGEFAND